MAGPALVRTSLRPQYCLTSGSVRMSNGMVGSMEMEKRKILHIQMLVLLLNGYLSMSMSVSVSLLAQESVKQCVLEFEHLFNEP